MKINSRWIKQLKLRYKNIKLLEENSGETISAGDNFLGKKIKAYLMKAKQKDYIKLRSFCTEKEMNNRVKRQLT